MLSLLCYAVHVDVYIILLVMLHLVGLYAVFRIRFSCYTVRYSSLKSETDPVPTVLSINPIKHRYLDPNPDSEGRLLPVRF